MRYLFLFAFFIIFAVPVNAAMIGVNIAEELDSSLRQITESSNDVMKITADVKNIGSVTYKTRARLDVFDGETIIFTGWSNEKLMQPGEMSTYNLYWMKHDASNPSARLRLYYGGEIQEQTVDIPGLEPISRIGTIEIINVRTFDDTIRFFIRSKKIIHNVIIMPHNYPLGWIIEQKEVGALNANQFKEVTIGYSTPDYKPITINIIAISENGQYYNSEEITLNRESGIVMYINLLLDYININFKSISG